VYYWAQENKIFFDCLCKGCPDVQQQAFGQGLPGNSFKLPLHCVAFDLLPHVSCCSWVGCHKVSCRHGNSFYAVVNYNLLILLAWLSFSNGRDILADCTQFLVLSGNSVLQSLSGVIAKIWGGTLFTDCCFNRVNSVPSLHYLGLLLAGCPESNNPGCECKDFL